MHMGIQKDGTDELVGQGCDTAHREETGGRSSSFKM